MRAVGKKDQQSIALFFRKAPLSKVGKNMICKWKEAQTQTYDRQKIEPAHEAGKWHLCLLFLFSVWGKHGWASFLSLYKHCLRRKVDALKMSPLIGKHISMTRTKTRGKSSSTHIQKGIKKNTKHHALGPLQLWVHAHLAVPWSISLELCFFLLFVFSQRKIRHGCLPCLNTC